MEEGKLSGTKRRRPGILPSQIANKQKRAEVHQKQQEQKKKDKKERRKQRDAVAKALGDAAPAKQIPHTLENTRELDETIVAGNDHEVLADEAEDEFSPYFSGKKTPKIMITTRISPDGKLFRMLAEFMAIIPNCFYYKRAKYPLKKICQWASNKEFTHLLVLNERLGQPSGLLVIHLPTGPTASFKLSSGMLSSEIKNHGTMTGHLPEIILSHFTTRLGRRVGRLIGSLFPHNPEFTGRRVCTWHNQRDFIFFRQHRYMFKEDGKGVRMQELGPRFTLKLKYILVGAFDTREGEYEWFHKRHEMETSKRRFLL